MSRVFPSVVSHYRAWVNETGLVLEGQDTGPMVEQIWGDSDYEYWVTVSRKHFPRLIDALTAKLGREATGTQGDKGNLALSLLKEAFQTDVFATDGDYRRWLEEVGIPSEFSSYT